MSSGEILDQVDRYYSEKVKTHGMTPRGVDWNSLESQVLRFERLLQILDGGTAFSITDYGCGYGALVEHLDRCGVPFEYRGFDISSEMVARAQERWAGRSDCEFFSDPARLEPTDYTVASGIFNVRLETSDDAWRAYMLETIATMARVSTRGFAFNALTLYSDPEKRRPDLYYADPLFFFDHCKRTLSRFVTLLHDYPLYEFTLLVRM